MDNRKKVILFILLFFGIILTGIIGYRILLGTSYIDSLYMTVITITTVGFREVAPLTDGAKIFSIILIFMGIAIIGYGFTSIITIIFEGNLKEVLRRKKMSEKIKNLNNHYIICGGGKVGRFVIEYFQNHNAEFVVIEKNEKLADGLMEEGILTLCADATHETTLADAGIEHAKGFIAVLSEDVDNVFAVLTARQMHENIYIVSKAIEPNAHQKLLKAGANKTISPYEIGGNRIASLILRPSIVSFLDIISRSEDLTLDMEEVELMDDSKFIGMKLADAKIPDQTGLIILALRRKGSDAFLFNPQSNELIQAGDTLIVLGTVQQTQKLKELIH